MIRPGEAVAFGFDVLFSDLKPGEFFSGYFPLKWLISSSDGVLAALASTAVKASSPTDILESLADRVVLAWQDKRSHGMSARAAAKAFERGAAVYVPHVESIYGELRPFLAVLCSELGIPDAWASCSLFLSPKGAEVPMHFDHDFGVNVLLRGRKRWTIALNDHVAFPTVGFDASKDPLPELRSYVAGNLLRSMPTSAKSIEVGPGGVAFLPRGCWHSTYALEDCVALDFALDPPCWVDYALSILRSELVKLAGARRSVLSVERGSRFHNQYTKQEEAVLAGVEKLRAAFEPTESSAGVQGRSD